jgi:hypothetical protein
MKLGWKKFHKYECGSLEASLENEYDLMIQKIVFESLYICDGKIENLQQLLQGDVMKNYTVYDFDLRNTKKNQKDNEKCRLRAIYSLTKGTPSEEDKSMAEWLLENDTTLKSLCTRKDHKEFLKAFIIRMMGILDRNSYIFYHLPNANAIRDEEIGSGIFAFASLFNHSCSPNLYRFFVDNKQVYVVKKPIAAGKQLFVGYLYVFSRQII